MSLSRTKGVQKLSNAGTLSSYLFTSVTDCNILLSYFYYNLKTSKSEYFIIPNNYKNLAFREIYSNRKNFHAKLFKTTIVKNEKISKNTHYGFDGYFTYRKLFSK